MYKRVVHENGFYKTVKLNGMKEFMQKEGMPEALICTFDDYKLCWEACAEGAKMVEWFGDLKVTIHCKFNEETDYKFPMEGVPATKYVVTKTGNGKYTSVGKDANGGILEWNFCFSGNGLKINARNAKTGDSASMELVKETPICGKWKPVVIEGVKDLMMAVGCPVAEAEKMANDFDCRLIIEEKGPIVHWNYCSKLTPVDFCFQYDKEVEVFDHMLKDNTKNVVTRQGNTLNVVTHSSKDCWITKCTFNTTFMVMKSCVQGLECMPMTMIFTREC